MWLSGLGLVLQSESPLVQFPVRAQAWAADQVPGWGRVRATDGCFSSSLSPSLPLSLKVSKQNLFIKK